MVQPSSVGMCRIKPSSVGVCVFEPSSVEVCIVLSSSVEVCMVPFSRVGVCIVQSSSVGVCMVQPSSVGVNCWILLDCLYSYSHQMYVIQPSIVGVLSYNHQLLGFVYRTTVKCWSVYIVKPSSGGLCISYNHQVLGCVYPPASDFWVCIKQSRVSIEY